MPHLIVCPGSVLARAHGCLKQIKRIHTCHNLFIGRAVCVREHRACAQDKQNQYEADEPACKPGSVVNDHLSTTAVTGSLQRPTSQRNGPLHGCVLGLAPDGVYNAAPVTGCAVVSYTALSPLPAKRQAVCFLWHFPLSHLSRTLSGILPCEARTFLRRACARDRPARSEVL